MKRGIFDAPVVTAVRFDNKGNSIPSRIVFGGRTMYAEATSGNTLIAFRSGEVYYWLEKHGRSWEFVSAR